MNDLKAFLQFCTTVTVYRKQYQTDQNDRKHAIYIKSVHKNCFWKSSRAQNMENNTVKGASVYTLRLPLCDISPGDVVFKGIVSDNISDVQGLRMSDLIERKKPDCFTVQTVSKNDSIPHLAHTKAEGV